MRTYDTRNTGFWPVCPECAQRALRQLCRSAPAWACLLRVRELRRALPEHRLVDDRVPPVDRLRLVPDHLHRHRPGHPGPLEVPDRRPPEVVRDAARAPGRLARLGPCLPEAGDRLAATVKHPRQDQPPRPLARSVAARCASRAARSSGVMTNIRPSRVLRRPRLQPERPGREVDLPPLERRSSVGCASP